jgi:hypothetical protein
LFSFVRHPTFCEPLDEPVMLFLKEMIGKSSITTLNPQLVGYQDAGKPVGIETISIVRYYTRNREIPKEFSQP